MIFQINPGNDLIMLKMNPTAHHFYEDGEFKVRTSWHVFPLLQKTLHPLSQGMFHISLFKSDCKMSNSILKVTASHKYVFNASTPIS